MVFITRDPQGNINGVYANPQPDALDDDGNVVCPGVATTEVQDDHPDVVAYRANSALQPVSELKQLADMLVAKGAITASDAAQFDHGRRGKPA